MKYAVAAFTLAAIFLNVAQVSANDFKTGLSAYQKRDYATALRIWTPLAEKGDADAQYNLGHMYRLGKGVMKDYEEAADWYLRASKNGAADAQFNLSVMYRYGRGVRRSNLTAHMWANIAGSQGHMDATQLKKTLARKLTPDDLTEAHRRAKVCMESNFKTCD
jgi:uncharacterized protein